jgi:hypothetical protein
MENIGSNQPSIYIYSSPPLFAIILFGFFNSIAKQKLIACRKNIGGAFASLAPFVTPMLIRVRKERACVKIPKIFKINALQQIWNNGTASSGKFIIPHFRKIKEFLIGLYRSTDYNFCNNPHPLNKTVYGFDTHYI